MLKKHQFSLNKPKVSKDNIYKKYSLTGRTIHMVSDGGPHLNPDYKSFLTTYL